MKPKWITIVGGILISLAVFLPWAIAEIPMLGSQAASGLEFDEGLIVLALGVVTLALGFLSKKTSGGREIPFAAIPAILAGAIAVYDLINFNERLGLGGFGLADDLLSDFLSDIISVGIGLYLVPAGALVAIVGSLIPSLRVGLSRPAVSVGAKNNLLGKRTQKPTGALTATPSAQPPATPPASRYSEPAVAAPARLTRPLVNAWLTDLQTGQSYQLYQGDTRIGRGSANDITLTDPSASREHALIREEEGHFIIYDRASRSGTLVNRQQVTGPTPLAHGDVIWLGDTELQFVCSS